jgi:hypothetical protein
MLCRHSSPTAWPPTAPPSPPLSLAGALVLPKSQCNELAMISSRLGSPTLSHDPAPTSAT